MVHWIPVNKRLPEDEAEVLTTYIVNGDKRKRYVETGNCIDGEWSSVWDEFRVRGIEKTVIAWAPMPSPYREQIQDIKLFNGCSGCEHHETCMDAFQEHSHKCNNYGKK